MVKRSIVALIIAVLIVSSVQAGEPAIQDPVIKKDGNWPWEYKAIDLCKIPVYMDIGHFVQLKECHKRQLKLEQTDCLSIGKDVDDFPCYTDCEEIQVKANFPAIFGATLTKVGPILKDTYIYWKDDINQITGSTGDWEKLTICLNAWKAEIWRAAEPTPDAKVGEITINVKPPDIGS